MSAMLAIAIKDLRTFSRQRASLFFTFIWPVCVAVLFGVLFGGSNRPTPRLPIMVVDEDRDRGSRAFANRLVARDTFDATQGSRAEALEAVRKGQRTAAVMLRPGFGEATSRMFYGAPPEVQLYTDPSRQAERGMLEGLLMQQGAERMQAMFSNPTGGRENVQNALQDLKKGAPGANPGLETFLGQLDTFLGYARRRAARLDWRCRTGRHRRRLGTAADHEGGPAAAAHGAAQWLRRDVPAGDSLGHLRVRDGLQDDVRLRAGAWHAGAPARVAADRAHRYSPASRWRPCWRSSSSRSC